MSVICASANDFPTGPPTPPPIPEKVLLLVNQLPELSDRELGPRLDRAMHEGDDIHHFSRAMTDAICSNRVSLVKELLRCKMPMGPTYMHMAVEAKAKDILTIFFNNGWDINTPMSALNPPILAYALEDREMTTWLLDRGADPNRRCDIDYTPLSYAVQMTDVPTIDLLLSRGGDVRIGQLVHWAIYRESNNLELVKFLIDRGAPFQALMYEDHPYSRWMFPFMKETPLHIAVAFKRRDVVCYLIQKGASVEAKDRKGQTVIQSADEDTRRVIVREIQNRNLGMGQLQIDDTFQFQTNS